MLWHNLLRILDSLDVFKCYFLEDFVSFPHQISHSCFFAVALNKASYSLWRKRYFFAYFPNQPVFFLSLLNYVLFKNLLLLQSGVPCNFDPLQPVQKGREYGIKRIGSTDKEHSGKVDLDIHKVVFEAIILHWIQNLHNWVL